MNSDFDAFVKREQTAVAEEWERVDWAKERDEWLGYLRELYEQTESFLAKYTETGEIKLSYRDIELNEENIGSYKVRQMILRIGRQEITHDAGRHLTHWCEGPRGGGGSSGTHAPPLS